MLAARPETRVEEKSYPCKLSSGHTQPTFNRMICDHDHTGLPSCVLPPPPSLCLPSLHHLPSSEVTLIVHSELFQGLPVCLPTWTAPSMAS